MPHQHEKRFPTSPYMDTTTSQPLAGPNCILDQPPGFLDHAHFPLFCNPPNTSPPLMRSPSPLNSSLHLSPLPSVGDPRLQSGLGPNTLRFEACANQSFNVTLLLAKHLGSLYTPQNGNLGAGWLGHSPPRHSTSYSG